MRATSRRLTQNERGETLIEFAFSAVLFLTIVFGTIQFGIGIWRYNTISDLAQEGARWASVRGNSTGAIQHASSTDVQNYVLSRASYLASVITVTTSADPSSLLPPSKITVTVSMPFPVVSALLPTS